MMELGKIYTKKPFLRVVLSTKWESIIIIPLGIVFPGICPFFMIYYLIFDIPIDHLSKEVGIIQLLVSWSFVYCIIIAPVVLLLVMGYITKTIVVLRPKWLAIIFVIILLMWILMAILPIAKYYG